MQTSVHDRAGRLVSFTESKAAGGALGSTRYLYDAGGHLRATEDPTGQRHWRFYDAAGRQVGEVDATGALVEYVYDRTDRLVNTIRYATPVDTTLLGTIDAPVLTATVATVRKTAPGDLREWRAYDSAGRLSRVARAVGAGTAVAVTETRYDGASRVIAMVQYAGTLVEGSTAVAAGRINAPASSAQDRISRNFFDADGRLLGTLDAEGYLAALDYDGAGRLVERVLYATATDAVLRATGSLAQLLPAGSGADIRSYTLYDGKGQLVAEIDGEKFLTETVYDAGGNIGRSARYASPVTAVVRADSTLADLRPAGSAADRVTSRSHDALGRVVEEVAPGGIVTRYGYDSAGRLFATVQAAGSPEARTLLARYDFQGRPTAELDAEGAALLAAGQTAEQVDAIWSQHGLAHVYDAAGRRTATTNAVGQRTLFFYDAEGRLRHTVNALGEVQELRYDAFGRVQERRSFNRRVSLTGLAGGLLTAATKTLLDATLDAVGDSIVRTGYSRDGQVASTTDALGNVSTWAFNAFGDQISNIEPAGAGGLLATYTVDRRGQRIATVSDAAGANVATTTQYDAFGWAVRTVDGNGNLHEQAYDRLGRTVATRDPLNALRGTSYDAFDRVLAQTDALGNVTRYAHDDATRSLVVTTPEGISTTTLRDRQGQVISVRDGKGQVTSYSYDRNGSLRQTTTSLATTRTVVDAVGRVEQEIDANNGKVAYTYDAANRILTRTVDPGGLNLVTRYAYDAKGQRITVTDPSLVPTQFTFDRKGQVLTQLVDPTGLKLKTVYAYDAGGRTLSVSTPGGTLTTYTYDKLGRRVRETVDPAGLNLQRTWAYDRNGNAVSSTDAIGQVTRYVYDAADRLVYEIDPAGGVRQTFHDKAGRGIKTVDHAVAVAVGLLGTAPTVAQVQALVVVDALSDVVQHRVFDRDGRLVATMDGMGSVVRFAHDANGNVVNQVASATRINPASWTPGTLPAVLEDFASDQRTATVYDALDRAIYTIDGLGAVVSTSYDGNGNVLQRIAYAACIPPATPPNAPALAAALAQAANPARDENLRYTYDAANRLGWTVDGTGAVTRRSYDANGNLVREVGHATPVAAGAAASSVVAGSLDRVRSMAYDAANRLVFDIDALNAVTERAYDGNGNLVKQVAYAKPLVTVPTLAVAGTLGAIRVAIVANPAADRVLRFGYDAANREAIAVDAEGALTQTQYDANGRATVVLRHGRLANATALAAATTLASLRNLVQADGNVDRITRRAYDVAGRLGYEIDPVGNVTGYRHDALGRVTSITRYATPLAPTAYASVEAFGAGIAALPCAADQVEQFTYDVSGNRTSSTNALGHTEFYGFDALRRRVAFIDRVGALWRYAYDAAGHRVTETSPAVFLVSAKASSTGPVVAWGHRTASIVTSLGYDALGRLLHRTEAAGTDEQRTTSYQYDAAGRQIAVIYPTVQAYDFQADVIASNGAAGVAQRTEKSASPSTRTMYDALGNAVAGVDAGGAASQKVYDRMGRVLYEVDALGFVTGYTRNAFGEVTSLVRFGSATSFGAATVSQAGQAVTQAQLEAVIKAAAFVHVDDRVLLSTYDRAGRLLETSSAVVFAYDSSAPARGQAPTEDAAARTRQAYNAFGERVESRTLRNALGATWSVTTHYFDRAGQEVATVDALGYLTRRSFDATGNLVDLVESSNALAPGSWTLAGYGAPPADAPDDRRWLYGYDRINRQTTELRVGVAYSASGDGTSTRGNLTTISGYDAVGNRTLVSDALGQSTYTFFDALGRVTGVAAPARTVSRADGSTFSAVPLTIFARDVYGDVVVQREYANGAVNAMTPAPLAASADDHETLTAHDVSGRTIQVTDAAEGNSYTSYDVFGRAVKTWQGVADINGLTRTAFQLNVFDRLGQVVEIRTPAANEVLVAGLQFSFQKGTANDVGNLATRPRVVLAWSNMVDPQGGTVWVQVDYMASAAGGVPAHAASDSTYSTAAAAAPAAIVDLSALADKVTRIQVLQQVGTQWKPLWSGTPEDATGARIDTVAPALAGLATTAMEYNAFGEMTRKGTQGGRQEYFDYDTAGRLWRTNSGDGVDRVRLFDLQGNVTAEIRSSGSGRDNLDIKTFANAKAAAANGLTRRSDTAYDLGGRVVQTVESARLELQGGVSVQRQSLTATIAQTAVRHVERSVWLQGNKLVLAWSSLAALGTGDVRVVVDYLTPLVTEEVPQENGAGTRTVSSGGVARSYTSSTLEGGLAVAGATLEWPEYVMDPEGGVGSVTRVRVDKKDVNGVWTAVIDQAPGYGENLVIVAAPANPAATIEFSTRLVGSGAAFSKVAAVNFGAGYRIRTNEVAAGAYEYQLKIMTPGEAARVTATGTISLVAPALAPITTPITFGPAGLGVLAWASPGAGMLQVLRYRVAGSTQAWSELAVGPRAGGGLDGVDTAGLPSGSYQFELVWSPAALNLPTAHATGTFTVAPGTPAQWVPASTVALVEQLRVYADALGNTVLAWDAANATVARYRVPGGAWVAAGIVNDEQSSDESGNVWGTQKAAIPRAPGVYEVEISGSWPVPRQVAATVTVSPPGEGGLQAVTVQVPVQEALIAYYAPVYETRTGTHDVAYNVFVEEARAIVGHDSAGAPIYAGHWEDRFRTETYPEQVLVRQDVQYRDAGGNVVQQAYQQVYETRYASHEVAYSAYVQDPPAIVGYDSAGQPLHAGHWETRRRTETVTEQVEVSPAVEYRDESGNVVQQAYAPVYEMRYATREVPYSVYVQDPPVLAGQDESGNPVYAAAGHWETRSRTESYASPVQVGERGIYAPTYVPRFETRTVTRDVEYMVYVEDAAVVTGHWETRYRTESYAYEAPMGQVGIYTAYTVPVYETRTATRQVPYRVYVEDVPATGFDESGNPVGGGHWEQRTRTEAYAYDVLVGQQPVYHRDGSGAILYQTVYVAQQQQAWVAAVSPPPTLVVTSAPYSPGYWMAGTPAQYAVVTSTAPASALVSATGGTAITQTVLTNNGDRWLTPTVRLVLDRWGNVRERTDPRSAQWKTKFTYDAGNRLLMQVLPNADGSEADPASADAAKTTYTYDALGQQVSMTDARGNRTQQVFDAGGHVLLERHPDGGMGHRAYDAFGQMIRATDFNTERLTVYAYDKLGHLVSSSGSAPVAQVNDQNVASPVEMRTVTDSWTYDQLGRKVAYRNGNGEVTRYRYDLRGNLLETRQPLGQSTRSLFDAQNRKIAELDANRFTSTWTYDYFGQLTRHTDLQGAAYTYTYDRARQLVAQASTRGQSLAYGYDAAGQLTSIVDNHLGGKRTTYTYDQGGRHVGEKVVQGGAVYQDNHLLYDARGYLRDVSDERVHLQMEYDQAGNRTLVSTRVNYQGVAGEVTDEANRFFRYDAMNRQVVVDGVDAAGNIGDKQGHVVTYDSNGNRTSDRSWGALVTVSQPIIMGYQLSGAATYRTTPMTYTRSVGYSTESYKYDGLNRLQGVERDGVQIDLRVYDGAGRVVSSGPANLPIAYGNLLNEGLQPQETNGKEQRVNRYNANGWLMHQVVRNSDGSAKSDLSWDPSESTGPYNSFAALGYDPGGNVAGYVVDSHDGGGVTEYSNVVIRQEGYVAGKTVTRSTATKPGSSTPTYDANGFLVRYTDENRYESDRNYVNDASGRALLVDQGGRLQRQLVVNGEVLGAYGIAVDAAHPTSGGNPNFANLADFDFGYSRITASYPNAAPGAYQVRDGDTLQGIAQAAYGDSALWFRIAEANGLASSRDLRVGQTLNIPNRVSTISNNSTTFKPYDPSRVQGDMTPYMAMPDAACGGVGKLVMLVVAVVATIYTAGALSGVMSLAEGFTAGLGIAQGAAVTTGLAGTLGTVGTMAVAGAAGSIASQLVGLGIGAIEKFSWKSVALSAIGSGVAAGVDVGGALQLSGIARLAANAAVGNALSQGIGVVAGLQSSFNWKAVAGSAMGAAAGSAVADQVAKGLPGGMDVFTKNLITRGVAGFAGGVVSSAIGAGRVSVQQVALDAFGNAVGQGLADAQDFRGRSGNPNVDAVVDAVNGFSAQGIGDYERTDVAANGGYNMGRSPSTTMGSRAAQLTKDELRRFEIQQEGPTAPQHVLIPGTGDFADLNTSLTSHGYSVTHDVLDSGLSRLSAYKADGSSSSLLVDAGMKGLARDRSFFSIMLDPAIATLGPLVATGNNALTYLGAKFDGDPQLAALARDALVSRTTAEAAVIVAGAAAGARVAAEVPIRTTAAELPARVTEANSPAQLRAGQLYEEEQLQKLGIVKNTTVFRPSAEQAQSASFKAIVGDAKLTPSGQYKGTIFDAVDDATGYLEIKGGTSRLNSTYQLRLQTYKATIDATPFTIQTIRPVTPEFRRWLDFWGVNINTPQ
jgi:YD repeat-containing protein